MPSVAVIGSGSAGLITAKTLLDDGFDVTVFTRDRNAGGVYAPERAYPGLTMNNVHGEFHFSSYPMPLPKDAHKTGGRLYGEDMTNYFGSFATKSLAHKIQWSTEVTYLRRSGDGRWQLGTIAPSGEEKVFDFDKIVLCTGGCSNPNVPADLSASAANLAGFRGPVVHSSDFASQKEKFLGHLVSTDERKVVIVGGGKSALDLATLLTKQNHKVTMVFESADENIAVPIPLPSFLRKSRFFSIFSPHIDLNTRLERFLHTTSVGSFLVRNFWNFLHWSSLKLLGVPSNSPLVSKFHDFWSIRTNDLGHPPADGFHGLLKAGKIELLAPARAARFSENGVILKDGRNLAADAVILATGFKSSWEPILDAETRKAIGLEPSLSTTGQSYEWNYTCLYNPPPPRPNMPAGALLVYRGIVPAQNISKRDFAVNGANFGTGNGPTHEITAHWISSYFLNDPFLKIPSEKEAIAEAERQAAWLRKRFPDTWSWANESYSAGIVFWNWPQLMDQLLEDMGLPSMRSGGNALTWPFKVIDVKEVQSLGAERKQKRMESS